MLHEVVVCMIVLLLCRIFISKIHIHIKHKYTQHTCAETLTSFAKNI